MNGPVRFRIEQWERSYAKDNIGNVLPCYWNKLVKEEITLLKKTLKT